jgi:hypothetical protein
MRRVLITMVCILLYCAVLAAENSSNLPWKVNKPIVTVQKDRYFPYADKRSPVWINLFYIGPNLELFQTASVPYGDKVSRIEWRRSEDNGKTWSDFKRMVPSASTVYYEGIEHTEYHGPILYNSESKALLETWCRLNNNGYHTYYRLSWDRGETWSTPKMLRYDEGEEFDPKNPVSPGYVQTNQGYFGNNIIKLSNGTVVTVLGNANRNRGPRDSSLCFIAKWNPAKKDYDWTPGKRVSISRDKSLYLSEPEVVELKDKRVLVVWRAEGTDTTPGRKYFSVSTDGGMSLSEPAEFKYDDGSSFYSPSSFHRIVRRAINRRLYWLGNITEKPPGGRGVAYPRYPLVIAEIDESGPIPTLKKNTVTVIDDRQPHEPKGIEFSNFTLIQNRETHTIDLYMVVTGHSPTKNYKYILTFVQ